jgi:hypothetical protein
VAEVQFECSSCVEIHGETIGERFDYCARCPSSTSRGIQLLGEILRPTHIRVYALQQALIGRANFLFGRLCFYPRISRASGVLILPDVASRRRSSSCIAVHCRASCCGASFGIGTKTDCVWYNRDIAHSTHQLVS